MLQQVKDVIIKWYKILFISDFSNLQEYLAKAHAKLIKFNLNSH